jgi:NAD(P)-dependent dehydrogenase (short-subunit alcohol dehydrogenase family)
VGPGLGFALAERLAESGMNIALASRNAERLDPLVTRLRSMSIGTIRAYGCDATNESSVKRLVSHVSSEIGVPDLVIYSVQGFGKGRALDIELPLFEECWRNNCLGAFVVARETARVMRPRKRGTIVLIGSTSGLIGLANRLNLAVGKFGLRALSQVLARELWPEGIHVVHLVIDADIAEGAALEGDKPQARPEDISDVVRWLHKQPRSAWTSEVDLRPWNERFWEHC